MGCFLACFGSSKDRNTRKQRHKVQPRPQPRFQRNPSYNAQSTVSLERSNLEKPISPVKEFRDDKSEEQLGSGSSTRKKVTFDTNVKTNEHVLVNESTDFELHNEEGENKGKVKEENVAKPRESNASSEHSSITSTSSSYPPNHRYQNCRGSDDEEDELCYDESDLDDDEDDDYEEFEDGTFNSRDIITKEVDVDGLVEEELNPVGLIRGV